MTHSIYLFIFCFLFFLYQPQFPLLALLLFSPPISLPPSPLPLLLDPSLPGQAGQTILSGKDRKESEQPSQGAGLMGVSVDLSAELVNEEQALEGTSTGSLTSW